MNDLIYENLLELQDRFEKALNNNMTMQTDLIDVATIHLTLKFIKKQIGREVTNETSTK